MNLQLKKIIFTLLARQLKALTYFKKFLTWFFKTVLGKPLKFLGRIILKFVLIRSYKYIFSIKKEIKHLSAPTKSKFISCFSASYIVHSLVVVITLLVIINNFKVKDVIAEDFGKKSILFSLARGNGQEEIIEESKTQGEELKAKLVQETLPTSALEKTPAPIKEKEKKEEKEEPIAVVEGGSALIKPGITITTIGTRPREKIEYYIVQPDDTISQIATMFGISQNTILWENKLSSNSIIRPGDKLTILPVTGVSHQVKNGETLSGIVKKYGGDVDKILEFNKLYDASQIAVGQTLIIPEGKITPIEPKRSHLAFLESIFNPSSLKYSTYGFIWPTESRRITQYYWWRHHAIDIGGGYGSPIYAVAEGRVETADWGGGYGNHVIINHGGGKKTLYAHLSKIYIKRGENVSQGQVIGTMGCTGWCTGNHLHFEIIIGGKKVNPLSYL